MLITGAVTMLCAFCVMILLKDSPADAGFDQDFSQTTGKKKDDDDKSKLMTWKDLIQSPFLWIVSFCYMVVFAAKTSVTDWGQMFIIEDLGHTSFVGSAFTSSVETGGFFGGIAAGAITDLLVKRHLTSGNPRMLAATWFMAGVALHLFTLTRFIDGSSAQILLSFVGFGLGACLFACIAIFGIVASESYPAHLSGTAHAIVALAANSNNTNLVFLTHKCNKCFFFLLQLEPFYQAFLAVTLLKCTTGVLFLLYCKHLRLEQRSS